MHKEETQVTIEKVNAETIEDFLGLITKLAEYEQLSPPDKEAKNRLRHDCLSITPKYQAFLGKVGERYVAYVIYFFTYSSFLALPTLYLEDLFVLQEYRHLGVGKTLFNFIKATAKQEGCGRIEFTVLTWNESSQQFYGKNKAKCLEDWYFYRITKEDF